MANALLQPSLARGELSPGLQARVDLATYGSGVALGENFVVLPSGGMQVRPGFAHLGLAKLRGSRLLRFVASQDAAYAIELGDGYARFWHRGALVRDGSDAIIELSTPWPLDAIWQVTYTQSVDVMYLAHPDYPPQRIRRLDVDEFAIDEYEYFQGPFRVINTNETRLMAASGKTGEVTITANFDAFEADMVGALIKLEVKALGDIKPWVVGERGLSVGDYRRSDGKVYRASSVPGGGTWTETGNIRPTHDSGREWDAPGTSRTVGSDTWYVGVEWEYVHSGYGIGKITEFVDARNVKVQTQVPFPDQVVGGVGTPVDSWDLVGDGSKTVFSIPGATSSSQINYSVTIDGEPV